MTVANLESINAAPVVALETIDAGALGTAVLRLLVRTVTAVIDAVAAVLQIDAHVIVALEAIGRAEPAVGEAGGALQLVRRVQVAIALAVAAEVLRDAVAAAALESAVGTHERAAVQFIRAVGTV